MKIFGTILILQTYYVLGEVTFQCSSGATVKWRSMDPTWTRYPFGTDSKTVSDMRTSLEQAKAKQGLDYDAFAQWWWDFEYGLVATCQNGQRTIGTMKSPPTCSGSALQSCAVANLTVTPHLEITVPVFAGTGCPYAQSQYESYMKALEMHEMQHIEFGRSAIKEFTCTLNSASGSTCDAIGSKYADTLYTEVLDKWHAKDIELDKVTNHGINDGACLGTDCAGYNKNMDVCQGRATTPTTIGTTGTAPTSIKSKKSVQGMQFLNGPSMLGQGFLNTMIDFQNRPQFLNAINFQMQPLVNNPMFQSNSYQTTSSPFNLYEAAYKVNGML
jgi:hypothetical protein